MRWLSPGAATHWSGSSNARGTGLEKSTGQKKAKNTLPARSCGRLWSFSGTALSCPARRTSSGIIFSETSRTLPWLKSGTTTRRSGWGKKFWPATSLTSKHARTATASGGSNSWASPGNISGNFCSSGCPERTVLYRLLFHYLDRFLTESGWFPALLCLSASFWPAMSNPQVDLILSEDGWRVKLSQRGSIGRHS